MRWLLDVLGEGLQGDKELLEACKAVVHPGETVAEQSDLVYTHDLEGTLTWANRAFEAATGFGVAELRGRLLKELLRSDSCERVWADVRAQLAGEPPNPVVIELRGRDGRLLAYEVTSRIIRRGGEATGVLAVARDLSSQRELDNYLRLLNSIVFRDQEAVLVAELKLPDPLGGRILHVNQAFLKLTGRSLEEVVGHTPRILFGPRTDRALLNAVSASLTQGRSARVELVNYRKDGSAYWAEIDFFVPAFGEGGTGRYWVAVQRDISAKKRAEELERDRTQILEMITQNDRLEKILARVAGMVEHQYPELRCSVLLLRDGEMIQAAGATLARNQLASLKSAGGIGLGGGAQSGNAAEHEIGGRCCWTFPVLSGSGNTIGALVITSQASRRPSVEELDLVSKASRLAALAIEQRQLTDRLAYQAHHDALTGLPNRTLFQQRLQQAIGQARQRNLMLAVMFIDLDGFKKVNDTLGHGVGDALLQEVARRLEGCIRRTDTLARMGGDEFTVLVNEIREAQDAEVVARKLLGALKGPFLVDGHELYVTASIGISVYPRDGRDASTLARNADSAMYRAKELGKNGYQFFEREITASALENLEIENALRAALEKNEFQLRYQPVVDPDGGLAELEALLVWDHPKLGTITPAQFIPVAEESGMIVPVGSWVLEEAARQSAVWLKSIRGGVRVAVNVSAVQFMRPGFVELVDSVVRKHRLKHSVLVLELTESVIMSNIAESRRKLERLKELGVGLAIDDFGTGYSSLSYLSSLPIDTLKIDQSFLEGITEQPRKLQLVRAIVELAHGLNLKVVAEGVESEEQLETLRSIGCDYYQGFLTGPPLPPEQAGEMLVERAGRHRGLFGFGRPRIFVSNPR